MIKRIFVLFFILIQILQAQGTKETPIKCLPKEGFSLYKICFDSLPLCKTIFTQYFSNIDEYGWMPTCKSLEEGNQKKSKKNEADLCEPPTFLLAVKYIMSLPNEEEFLKMIWEPLQLRYKHCQRTTSNFHLEGGYKFSELLEGHFEDYYQTSLGMNCWMAEYSRTLDSLSALFVEKNITVRRLKGFNYLRDFEMTQEAIEKYNYDKNLDVFSSLLGYQPIDNPLCSISDPECLEITPYRLKFDKISSESLCPYTFNLTTLPLDFDLVEYILHSVQNPIPKPNNTSNPSSASIEAIKSEELVYLGKYLEIKEYKGSQQKMVGDEIMKRFG